MSFIRPVVDRDTAWQRLDRRRLRRLSVAWSRVTGRGRRGDGSPSAPGRYRRPLPYLEILWLPCFRVTFEVASGGRTSTVDVLVGGHDRQVTICQAADIQWDSEDGRERFGPDVTETEAPALARRGLLAALSRGRRWGARPSMGEAVGVQLVHYPFWVYYFERRKRMLDVRMLDAVTGSLAGPKAKAALFAALTGGVR